VPTSIKDSAIPNVAERDREENMDKDKRGEW